MCVVFFCLFFACSRLKHVSCSHWFSASLPVNFGCVCCPALVKMGSALERSTQVMEAMGSLVKVSACSACDQITFLLTALYVSLALSWFCCCLCVSVCLCVLPLCRFKSFMRPWRTCPRRCKRCSGKSVPGRRGGGDRSLLSLLMCMHCCALCCAGWAD